MRKPLCIDLFCGLGGWTKGFLEEGYDCIGFDIVRHQYGGKQYPAQLVLHDVLTLHGSQLRDAACIVASPPCQKYSYMAQPWTRAKREGAWQRWERDSSFGDFRLNDLFDACFRLQREASTAAGWEIPMLVENVKGAQPWVGRAAWHHGSYYLWGDVPALMPHTLKTSKTVGHANIRDGHTHARHLTNQRESDAIKQHGSGAAWFDKALDERRREATAIKNGKDWFGSGENCSLQRRSASGSTSRQAASAMIAEIPFDLAQWIAKCFKPETAAKRAG